MSEQKESSVLFSLKELMNLEEDRIRNEETERSAAAASAERARVEAERQAREAEEHRIRAEEERRRSDEQRSREEQARLEAIRHAEVEKARVEAEQRARLEAMAAQQKHEQNLAVLQHDQGKKKLRNLLIGGVIGVLVLGSGAGFLAYSSYQDSQRKAAALEAKNRDAEERAAKLEREMKDSQAKADSLVAALSSAKDDAERARLQKQLDDEKAHQDDIKKGRPGVPGGKTGGTSGGATGKKCAPGDPLCSEF